MTTIIFLSLLLLGCRTIMATKVGQQDWNATATANIKGPNVDQVWPYVSDFCNLYKIFPSDVSFCVQGSNGQPGQIRYSSGKYPSPSDSNITIVLWAREELLAINANKKYVTYQIHENNRGLDKFIGTMQVLPSGGDNGCIFKWSVVASPIAGATYEGFVDSLSVGLAEIVATYLNIKYHKANKMEQGFDPTQLRSRFLQVINSRRSSQVPLDVTPGKPVTDPMFQENPKPKRSEAMESCPRKNIPGLDELLQEENFYLTTEESEQGRLPVIVLSLKQNVPKRRPAIVFLHSTHKCKEWLRPLLEAYASRGYIAVAIDSRYHGERASTLTTYREALVSSWKRGDTMPFIFDTVWDLIKLADYLSQREDIDHSRIGITGESLGGMHAWFAAAADTRYSVVAPIIGVQGFRWAIENGKWQGRVDSIKAVFEEARIDLGKADIDEDVVEKVWDRIAPGLASEFDAPFTIPSIAPRPLIIINGEADPRCPLHGLDLPISKAMEIYEEANCLENFKLLAEPGIGHQMTPLMVKEASDWFDKFFELR